MIRNYLLTLAGIVPTTLVAAALGVTGWGLCAVTAAAGFANLLGFTEATRGWRS